MTYIGPWELAAPTIPPMFASTANFAHPFSLHLVTAPLMGTCALRQRVTLFTGLEAELALLARPSRLAQTDLTQHVGNTRDAGSVVVAGTAARTGLKRRRGRGVGGVKSENINVPSLHNINNNINP